MPLLKELQSAQSDNEIDKTNPHKTITLTDASPSNSSVAAAAAVSASEFGILDEQLRVSLLLSEIKWKCRDITSPPLF